MSHEPLRGWHDLVATKNAAALEEVLADEVVFYSPIVHTPQVGKAITTLYLTAALKVFFNGSFRYVREVTQGKDAFLEFTTEIDGIQVNGVDMIRWNDEGKIVEFKVMVRPLKAIQTVHRMMGEMLEQLKPQR